MEKYTFIKNAQYEKVTDLIAELLMKYRREIEQLDQEENEQSKSINEIYYRNK